MPMNYMCENAYITRNHAMKRLKLQQINVTNVLIATAIAQFLYMLMYSHLQESKQKRTYLCKYNFK